jgi:hypothetical protein
MVVKKKSPNVTSKENPGDYLSQSYCTEANFKPKERGKCPVSSRNVPVPTKLINFKVI